MTSKELRTDCPACRARLVVDIRTQKVLTWREAATGSGARPGDGDEWTRAVARATGSRGRGVDRFESALAKVAGRERDLDELYDEAKSKRAGRTDLFDGKSGKPSVTGDATALWSPDWMRRLAAAEAAACASRVIGSGGEVLEIGASRVAIGGGSATLFDPDLVPGGELGPLLARLAGHTEACARLLPCCDLGEASERLLAHGWIPRALVPVFTRGLDALPELPSSVRAAARGDFESWCRVFSRASDVPDSERDGHVAQLATEFADPKWCLFLSNADGEDVGASSLWTEDGVAVLVAAATTREFRRRGHHRDAIAARLHAAEAVGAECAIAVGAEPGRGLAALVELGFQLAFHEMLWVPRSNA